MVDSAPLVVFLHGGYWQELSKLDAAFAAPGLVASGVALAAVDYTLAPHAPLERIVDQATRAVGWLSVNGASLGVEIHRLSLVSGHSGGGASGREGGGAAASRDRRRPGPPGGVFDLRPIARTSINDALGLDEAEARAPQRHPSRRPPWPRSSGASTRRMSSGARAARSRPRGEPPGNEAAGI